jgi:hypothetical protein
MIGRLVYLHEEGLVPFRIQSLWKEFGPLFFTTNFHNTIGVTEAISISDGQI